MCLLFAQLATATQYFFPEIEPTAALAAVLTLGVLFVNGWTDAPNAITAVVASKVLSFRRASILSAVFNLLGGLWSVFSGAGVAATITSFAAFGDNPSVALRTLCAALASLILWSVAAWWFGLPTSESHGLIAALAGAALALGQSLHSLNWVSLCKILLGLFGSVFFGFLLARVCFFTITSFMDSRRSGRMQLPLAAGLSFFHGAQDGQKFIAVLLLCLAYSKSASPDLSAGVPLCAALPALLAMGAGTCIGGRRIIETLGTQMVRVDKRQGLAAELSCVLCLACATLLGLPVSTTHTKAAALWGSGTAQGSSADHRIMFRLVFIWFATFPCCGILSYCMTKLLLWFPVG